MSGGSKESRSINGREDVNGVEHVDVVFNDWNGLTQRRIGWVTVGPDGRAVVMMEPGYTMSGFGSWDSSALAALEDVARIDGFYRFCTGIHSQDVCPFRDGDEVPMNVQSVGPGQFVLRSREGTEDR